MGECRVFYCYLQDNVSSFLIAVATFSTFLQNNVATRAPVSKQGQILCLCVCLNVLHIPGREVLSLKGPNSAIRHFTNLSEQNSRLGIINTWFLYLNILFKSQNLPVKPNQLNMVLQKLSLLSCPPLPILRDFLQFYSSSYTICNSYSTKGSLKHNKNWSARQKEYFFLPKHKNH